MGNGHAILSASGASRWLACPPSARYEQQFPEQESEYADEGTLAHAIGVLLIEHKAYGIPFDKRMIELRAHELYTEEMWEFCNDFADYVIEIVRGLPGQVMIFLERRLDMREWIPEGFGTSDVVILCENMLIIVDFKYGKGVPVSAYENKQLMTYTLGALYQYSVLFKIRTCRMVIYQPRIGNIDQYEIGVQEVMRWGYEVLKPGALVAWEGEGSFAAGEHCRFCRARSYCTTNASYNLSLAKHAFMPEVTSLRDDQLVTIYNRAGEITRWVNGIKDMMLKEALAGKEWPGLKLVRGRSVRKYANEKQIIENLVNDGIVEEEIVNKKLTGIIDLTAKISKLQFEQHVQPFVIKPEGKPTLVVEEDKRPALNASSEAAEVFAED